MRAPRIGEARPASVAAVALLAALGSGCINEGVLRAEVAGRMRCPLAQVSMKERPDVDNPGRGDVYEVSGCGMRNLVAGSRSGKGHTSVWYLPELTEQAITRGELRLTTEESRTYAEALHRRRALGACEAAGALSSSCTATWAARFRLEGDVAVAIASRDLGCPAGEVRIVSALPIGQEKVNSRFVIDGCGQRAVYVSTCADASDPSPPARSYAVEVLVTAPGPSRRRFVPWDVDRVQEQMCAYLMASRTPLRDGVASDPKPRAPAEPIPASPPVR